MAALQTTLHYNLLRALSCILFSAAFIYKIKMFRHISDSWWLTFDLFLQMPWVIRSAVPSWCYPLPSLPQSSLQVFKPLSHVMTVSVNSVLQHEGWIRIGGWDSASEGVPAAIFSQVMAPCELKTPTGRRVEMLSDSQQLTLPRSEWGSSCLSHQSAQLFQTFKVYDGLLFFFFFFFAVACIVTMETTDRETTEVFFLFPTPLMINSTDKMRWN